MTIHQITAVSLFQQCAKCGAQNTVALAGLVAGVGQAARVDARVVALPACGTCGSTEYLIRTDENEPNAPTPGSFSHLHHMLVDELHAQLVQAGKVNPALKGSQVTQQTLARPPSPDDVKKWFPNGFVIAIEVVEQPTTSKPAP